MDLTNEQLLHSRETVLANGGRMSLATAVAHNSRLLTLRDADDLEWDALYHLRELALDRSLDPQPLRALAREGLVGEDGRLDPEFRDVILSATDGVGRHLTLKSPFTDELDRALAEFQHARLCIAAAANDLGPALTHRFLAPPRLLQLLDGPNDIFDRPDASGGTGGDGDPPPELGGGQTFADRVMRRAFPPTDPAGPGSPPRPA